MIVDRLHYSLDAAASGVPMSDAAGKNDLSLRIELAFADGMLRAILH